MNGALAELVGRAEILDELCSALTSGGAGAVILGRTGVGKTAVLRAAADRLQDTFHIIPVRGTDLAAGTPYGALACLISGLPAGTEEDPLALLQELSRALAAGAQGRRILLTVDNADRLDSYSLMVLSQLLRRGTIAVLAAASLKWEAAHELTRLWSEGLLTRVDLELLTEQQTRQLMQQMLHGPVSSQASGTMWRETEGRPRMVRLMTQAQVRAGTLVRRETTWVRTGPFIHTGEVGEVVAHALDRLGAQERRLMEILALCVSLPLPTVLGLVPTAAVDALEEQQLITVAGDTPDVRIGGGIPGTVIAASIAPGRRRKLWEDIASRVDPKEMRGEELAAYMGWALSCGEELRPADALRAARAANERADAAAALRFVRAVPAAVRSQELVLEEIRALHTAGKPAEARRVFDRAEDRLVPEERASYVPLLLRHSQTLARVPGTGDPYAMLAAIDATRPPEGDAPGLAAALILRQASLAADGGSIREVPDRLGELAAQPLLDPATRLHAAALNANVLALAGRAPEALQILEQLGPPGDYPLVTRSAAEVCTRIFDTYILTGELDRAAAFVKVFVDSGSRPSTEGSAGELAMAVLAAWQGQDGAARTALTGALGQLRVHDPQGMLPLARTLAAYVHRERRPEATELLNQARSAWQRPAYFRGFLLRYFSIQAETAEVETRCGRLRAEAAAALEAGYAAPAMLFLAAAVRAGDKQAAEEVLAAAPGVSGRFSALLTDFAAGILRSDPVLLVTAAKGFSDRGQYLLSLDAARAAEDLLANGAPGERKALARTARALVNTSLRRMQNVGSRAETLAKLSQFEADLAHRAVTLATTAQIAGELNLSPRTIEWHLGKIFAKLHVSGRSELAEVLA